jgi:hypothetical protein
MLSVNSYLAMNKYLTKLISGKMYSTMKNKSLSFLEKMPRMHEFESSDAGAIP